MPTKKEIEEYMKINKEYEKKSINRKKYLTPIGKEVEAPVKTEEKPDRIRIGGYCMWSTIAIIFAFLFPLLGFIIAIIAYEETSKTGKNGKKLSVAAMVASLLMSVVFTLVLALFVMASLA